MDAANKDLNNNYGWSLEDRRVFARFKAEFAFKYAKFNSRSSSNAEMRDLCAKGFCAMTNEFLPANSHLDIWLKMPDNGEEIYIQGRVIWSDKAAINQYRVGVELDNPELMVVSIVLRTLHAEAR